MNTMGLGPTSQAWKRATDETQKGPVPRLAERALFAFGLYGYGWAGLVVSAGRLPGTAIAMWSISTHGCKIAVLMI